MHSTGADLVSGDRLTYLPLGGAGEIGMNMYAYGHGPRDRERFVIVDAGVMFPDMETTPGVDLIIPEFSWLCERRDRVDALFLTHAHEDHIGAVPFVLEELNVPVFARRFTAELTRRKLAEFGIDPGRIREVGATPEQVEAGPFSVEFVPVSHSVPESSSLLLEAGGHRIIHTGDLRLDRDPVIGPPFDSALWSRLAKPGVRALVCDSTNIFSRHEGHPEGSVGPAFAELLAETEGAMAATTFASNLARLKQLAEAAHACGRSVVLLGRAMVRMVEVGRATGVLDGFPSTVSPEEAVRLPRNRLLLLTTGSQGEPRSATAQLARGRFRGLELIAGDTLLYSSKTIPGNERSVALVMNRYAAKGVTVIDESAGHYHVSGHANRPDLAELYRLVVPDCVVPMHGEHRHLVEHMQFARGLGLSSFLVPNGTVLDIGGLRVDDGTVHTGRLYLDGSELTASDSGVVRKRQKMARSGLACVSVVLRGRSPPRCSAEVRLVGMVADGGSVDQDEIAEEVVNDLERGGRHRPAGDGDVQRRVETLVRQIVRDRLGKTPEVSVIVHRT